MVNIYIIDNKTSRSSVYGIGTYINQLENSLLQSDLSVCFIHLNTDTLRFSQKIENGFSHWYIPFPKNKYKDEEKHNSLYLQNIVFIFRKYIQQTDNLIFHLNYPKHQSFIDALKEVFNCKIILAIHYFSWCFDILGNVSQLQSIINKPETELNEHGMKVKKSFDEEKTILCSVDKIISLSIHTSGLLQNIYNIEKNKIITIYNGLENKANKKNDRKLIRIKYNLPLDAPVVVFAGRLDPIKGLSNLLIASKIILNHQQNCHIIIAGSGDYETYLKECDNKWMNIHFTGLLNKTELYEIYSIADFGVMPSYHEQCSFVAIEMMMHGLPIIASNSTGLSEMVDEGISGLHVPVGEYTDKAEIDNSLLAEKTLYMLKHPEECKHMGANARRRYETVYSLEIFSKKMIEFYQSLY